MMNWKGYGSGCNLLVGTIPEFAWRDWGKP